MTDATEEIRRLLDAPESYWPDDGYFHRRNREKLNRAATQLRKEHNGSLTGLPETFLDIVAAREAASVGTIFIMSNGGAGCHHLGLLLSELPGLRMTDEVYHPVELLESAEGREGDQRGAVIEALNVLHFGTSGAAARRDWVVNIGHLRPEAKPTRLRQILPSARFVLLLRNPYEVATSRAFRKPDYRAASGADDIADLDYLRQQSRFTGTFFGRARAETWDAVIRYEDLVRDPVVAVGDMLAMLDIAATPGALRAAATHRSATARGERGTADNLNVAPRAALTPPEAEILADALADEADRWGYRPPTEVADHLDRVAAAAGIDGSTRRFLWTPLFSNIHQNRESYERLGRGEVKVFRNLPVTELPTGDDPWNADPLDNVSWRLFYHSLGWLLTRSWAVGKDIDAEENLAEIERVVLSHIAATVESNIGDEWAWDDHATGDRLAVLAYLYHHHLADRVDRSTRERLLAAMEVHVERIAEFRHRGQWLDSNHGVFHAMGALNVGIVLGEHPLGRRATEVGLEYLRAILGQLVHLGDGVSVEQSVSYHSINLVLIRKVQETVQANQLDVGVDLAALCGSMVGFNHAVRGIAHLPSIGDTPFGYQAPTAGLDAEPGEALADGARHAISGGAEGAPFPEPTVYDEAGLVVLRRGEPSIPGTVSRAVFVLHRSRAHHGHFDQLSLTYQLDDHDVFVDSGGPYAYGDPLRFSYFVAARAHNVVMIDGRDHQSRARRLGAGDAATSPVGVQWAVGEREGDEQHRVRRAVALIDGETLVVFDAVEPSVAGRHTYTSLWHLDPEADPRIERAARRELAIALPHPTRPMRFGAAVKGATCRIERGVDAAEPGGPQGWVTRELGTIVPAPVVAIETSGKGHHAATWVAPPGVDIDAAPDRVKVSTAAGRTVELEYRGGDELTVRTKGSA